MWLPERVWTSWTYQALREAKRNLLTLFPHYFVHFSRLSSITLYFWPFVFLTMIYTANTENIYIMMATWDDTPLRSSPGIMLLCAGEEVCLGRCWLVWWGKRWDGMGRGGGVTLWCQLPRVHLTFLPSPPTTLVIRYSLPHTTLFGNRSVFLVFAMYDYELQWHYVRS